MRRSLSFVLIFFVIFFYSCNPAKRDDSVKAYNLKGDKNSFYTLNDLEYDLSGDFSVQFWIQSDSEKPTVLISQKEFPDKSIKSQKNPGWAIYSSGGSFAWTVGSGTRRLNYERDNGDKMPITDGKRHLISMTYSKALKEFRLYYDGLNRAIYKVEFDFSNELPLTIGTLENSFDYSNEILPQILDGARKIQALVDSFSSLNLDKLANDELLDLIVDPDDLIKKRLKNLNKIETDTEITSRLTELKKIRAELLKNPYTVYQIMELTLLKPVSKIYYLDDQKVNINKGVAKTFTDQTRLYPSYFMMDNLKIRDNVLSPEEVLNDYNLFRKGSAFNMDEKITKLNVGVWNIWHGGIHWNKAEDGWDSRMRIVEMIKEKDLDVVLLQETYSSGDFIAAELGYYFATSSDWDYCFQGSNISVLSRYPISEVFVPFEASFMNIGTKLNISQTQDIYSMSNWYGMQSFPVVFKFHEERFAQSDEIPVLFGGDFNAVPHTDGGESPASIKLLENGFTDAYRSKYPDVEEFPGYSHNSGKRIDQLYYKGKGLKNISTEIINSWPGGFPSDHFLIFSKFELN